MAQRIVPRRRKRKPAPLSSRATLAAYEVTYWEVRSLANFLCEEDGLTYSLAMQAAAADLGYCLELAVAWDDQAFDAGNDDAAPF